MKRTKVESSNIKAIGWKKETLEIEFLSGGIYQYREVPEYVYNNLMASESKGKFIASDIKGKYNYIKIN